MPLTQSETEIAAIRAVCYPRAVRLNHCPNWFRIALLKAFGPCGSTSGDVLVNEHLYRHGWLDHWGSSEARYSGAGVAFVSEPYHVTSKEHAHIADLAERLDCNVEISANSWWNPPNTLRIEFYRIA